MLTTATQLRENEATRVTETAKLSFIDQAKRVRRFDLQWPIDHDGKLIDHVNLRRLTHGDVAAFMAYIDETRKTNPNVEVRFPIFVDDAGELIPDAIFNSLDADDAAALTEAGLDFLPLAFRGVQAPDSALSTGSSTDQSSGASSDGAGTS